MKRFILAFALLGLWFAPAQAQQSVVVPATTNTIAIVGGTTAGLKIVSGISGKSIYVTAIALTPSATSVVAFTYGTGTNCGTGTTSLTGSMGFVTGNQALMLGTGNGAILVVPQGQDLCIIISTAVAAGFLAYSIF